METVYCDTETTTSRIWEAAATDYLALLKKGLKPLFDNQNSIFFCYLIDWHWHLLVFVFNNNVAVSNCTDISCNLASLLGQCSASDRFHKSSKNLSCYFCFFHSLSMQSHCLTFALSSVWTHLNILSPSGE